MAENSVGMKVGMKRLCQVVISGLAICLLFVPAALTARSEPTVDELKARVGNTGIADRPSLCLRISERQLDVADRFYLAGDSDKAQVMLTDVVAFAELARDYAIQSHKHEKQSEIAIRKMARKLGDLKHSVSRDDQDQIQNAIDRLQRIRDDLLAAMFPKGIKK
jgi:hypothetical protein